MRLVCAALSAILLLASTTAEAQQNVRVPVEQSGRTVQLAAQLFRPANAATPAPAIAIFHGCGGPGQNTSRMAGLLASWGYVALVVDSFSARGLKDICGRNWPTQADAEARAHDIDAALAWLARQPGIDPKRFGIHGLFLWRRRRDVARPVGSA